MKLSDLIHETKGPRGKAPNMALPLFVGVVPVFVEDGTVKIRVSTEGGLQIPKSDASKAESVREHAVAFVNKEFGTSVSSTDLQLGWSGKMVKSETQYGFYVYYVILDKELPGMIDAAKFAMSGRQSQRAIMSHVLEKVKKH